MVEDSDGAVARAGILKRPVTDVGRQSDNAIRKQGKKKGRCTGARGARGKRHCRGARGPIGKVMMRGLGGVWAEAFPKKGSRDVACKAAGGVAGAVDVGVQAVEVFKVVVDVAVDVCVAVDSTVECRCRAPSTCRSSLVSCVGSLVPRAASQRPL